MIDIVRRATTRLSAVPPSRSVVPRSERTPRVPGRTCRRRVRGTAGTFLRARRRLPRPRRRRRRRRRNSSRRCRRPASFRRCSSIRPHETKLLASRADQIFIAVTSNLR